MWMLFKLALKNLKRHAKRNRFAMASIASGLATLFWIQCIFSGHNRNTVDIATTTLTGNLQVYKSGYLDERALLDSFDPAPVEAAVAGKTDVILAKRVHFPSILSSGEGSTPVILYGIDPERESQIITLRENLTEGEFLKAEAGDECSANALYLGARAAKKLRVTIGDKIVVMGQAVDGTIGNDLFRVMGIFDSGSPEFDKNTAFATRPCVARVALTGDRVHEVILKTSPVDGVDLALQSELQSRLPSSLQVNTWRETVPQLSTMIRVNTGIMNLITVVFFLVITLGVVNAMLMNVFERTKEFGVMLSLGTTPAQVRWLIVFESLTMGILAALFGTLLGTAAIFYHAKMGFDITPFLGKNGVSFVGFKFKSMVYPSFEWGHYLKLVLIELAFVVGAGIYPAHRAAGLDPVETLR